MTNPNCARTELLRRHCRYPGPRQDRQRHTSRAGLARRGVVALTLLSVVLSSSGCAEWARNSVWNPAAVGRYGLGRSGPLTTHIVRNVSIQDVDDTIRAEPPTEDDLIVQYSDYILKPGDVIQVSVFELVFEGFDQAYVRQISDLGFVSMPILGVVKASNKTGRQLELEIADMLRGEKLIDPQVSVQLVSSRQEFFYTLGVLAPGQYNLFRRDLRLVEALALLGDVQNNDIKTLYVIRQRRPRSRVNQEQLKLYVAGPGAAVPPATAAPAPDAPSFDNEFPRLQPPPTPPGALPPIFPPVDPALGLPPPPNGNGNGNGRNGPPNPNVPGEPTGMAPSDLDLQAALAEEPPATVSADMQPVTAEVGSPVQMDETAQTSVETTATTEVFVETEPSTNGTAAPGEPLVEAEPLQAAVATETTWVWMDGQWVELSTQQKAPPPIVPSFDWDQMLDELPTQRIIAINLEELRRGSARFNIVVRDGDIIYVPNLRFGEYYVMGEVSRPGAYLYNGRGITLKQAIASAGNLGPLAWPETCQLVRRVGPEKEEHIIVNLDAIFAGRAPDIYLKPNDLLNVGTNFATTFLAAIRNGFTAQYGFDFSYSRDFYGADGFDLTPNYEERSRFVRTAAPNSRQTALEALRNSLTGFGLP